MSVNALIGGFKNPATDAAFAFRAVMNAMARPGRIEKLHGGAGPEPLSLAASTVLLTLCDGDVGLHLTQGFDTAPIREWLAFHTGVQIVDATAADFVLGTWDSVQPLSDYRIGTSEYPDRSATVIVEISSLTNSGATLSGPGIKDTAKLSLPEIAAFQDNASAFPLGLDFIFTAGSEIASLPRTTQVR